MVMHFHIIRFLLFDSDVGVVQNVYQSTKYAFNFCVAWCGMACTHCNEPISIVVYIENSDILVYIAAVILSSCIYL